MSKGLDIIHKWQNDDVRNIEEYAIIEQELKELIEQNGELLCELADFHYENKILKYFIETIKPFLKENKVRILNYFEGTDDYDIVDSWFDGELK